MLRKFLIKFFILLSVGSSWQLELTSSFGHCVKQDKPNLIKCAGQQAIETLQQFNELSNFTLADGVVLSKDESIMGRSVPISFIDQDPTDFRSILENAGAVMGERTLQWDMSRVFPGLQLRVGPSMTGGLLEFVMDSNSRYDEGSHIFQEEESTARIISKKFILPFLLGLKFNLATLLPLILGAIILISKKAALLSKLALFITGFFGVGAGSLLGLGALGTGGGFGGLGGGHVGGYGYHHPQVHEPGFIGAYKGLSNDPRVEEEKIVDNFYDYDKKHLLKDRSARLYEREIDQPQHQALKYRPTNQRSFAWAPSNN